MATTTTRHLSTNCTYRYTLSITSDKISETKENFNNTPSIHEIIEEDENDSPCSDQNCNKFVNDKESKKSLQEDRNDEDDYASESFCSEDSCSETDFTNSQVVLTNNFSTDHERLVRNVELEDRKDQEISNCTRNSNESNTCSSDDRFNNDENGFPAGRARSRRKNMSFTDEEVRKIERENELLLRRIMAQHKTRDKLKEGSMPPSKTSSSAVNRRKFQRKVEGDNMRLLRRIQQAKPCVLPHSTTPGYRKTLI